MNDLSPLNRLFAVSNGEALENRTQLPGVKEWVEKKIKDDYAMNIKVAFKLLGKVCTKTNYRKGVGENPVTENSIGVGARELKFRTLFFRLVNCYGYHMLVAKDSIAALKLD